MGNYENIKNYLLNNISEIGYIVREINFINNSLAYLEYWDNNEEFFNKFFYNNPMEAVRSSFFGDYDCFDDYVQFDRYRNLKSLNVYELENEYKENIEEIVKSLLEHYHELFLCYELIKLIEECK